MWNIVSVAPKPVFQRNGDYVEFPCWDAHRREKFVLSAVGRPIIIVHFLMTAEPPFSIVGVVEDGKCPY